MRNQRKEMIRNQFSISKRFLQDGNGIVVLISGLSFLIFMAVCYWISMILGDHPSFFWQIFWSLAGRSLSLLFGKIGFSGGLAFAIGLAVKAILTADGAPMVMYGADAGSEASVNQELHHPSRSGPAASSSTVEQPAPIQQPLNDINELQEGEAPGQPAGVREPEEAPTLEFLKNKIQRVLRKSRRLRSNVLKDIEDDLQLESASNQKLHKINEILDDIFARREDLINSGQSLITELTLTGNEGEREQREQRRGLS